MYFVCYVVVDSASLLRYNEMMISISSLRFYGYKGRVLVVTDYQTNALLVKKDLNDYNVEVVVADVPDQFNQLQKSRFLKTSLRSILTGDYLFVDTDTVFSDLLPEHISDEEVAMITDCHNDVMLSNTGAFLWWLPLSQKSGMHLIAGKPYFNSGVIWAKDTKNVRRIYENWHKNWLDSCKKGVPQDQPSLNHVNNQMGYVIKRLDDKFNVQLWNGETIPFSLLGEAVIIHYGHPNPDYRIFLLSLPEIRNLHFSSKTIQDIIRSPKTAFIDGKIISAQDYDLYYQLSLTYHYRWLKKIYKSSIFKASERALALMSRVRNRLIRTRKRHPAPENTVK